MRKALLLSCLWLGPWACGQQPPPPDAGTVTAASDAGGPPGDAGADAGLPVLSWAPCDVSRWPDGYPLPADGVECTTVAVPVEHGNAAAGSMDLTVARHKSRHFPTGKVVFQLAGGPGGSSVAQSGLIPRYLPGLLDDFDLVYVDQRGTGGSGALECRQGYPETQAEWEACGDENAARPLDHYLTADAADDLDEVRRVLGYQKLYVRGGSYGTRLGLELLRRHGDRVAAAVLDGLVPPELDLFGDITRQLDDGIAQLVADCGADAACRAASPALAADLEARRLALRARARPIRVGGQTYYEDEVTYLEALFGALDWNQTRYRVPRAIHDSVAGDDSRWDQVLSAVFGVTVRGATEVPRTAPRPLHRAFPLRQGSRGTSYVAPGLFATVACAEFLPNTSLLALQALVGQLKWADERALGEARACARWRASPVPAALRSPVSSSAKVLLLSGEIDLRTPVALGNQVKQTLPNATHLVVPHQSHSTMGVPCVGRIISDFLATDGDAARVDSSCLQQLPQPAW